MINEINYNMKEIRLTQNALKLKFLKHLREYYASDYDPTLQYKMLTSKAALLAFERTMPGSAGAISSVDYDSTNRDHQAV